jgi:hypothetical protein
VEIDHEETDDEGDQNMQDRQLLIRKMDNAYQPAEESRL